MYVVYIAMKRNRRKGTTVMAQRMGGGMGQAKRGAPATGEGRNEPRRKGSKEDGVYTVTWQSA